MDREGAGLKARDADIADLRQAELSGRMKIRAETDLDADDIQKLTQAAFAGAEHGSGTEDAIINKLRETRTLGPVGIHRELITAAAR